MTRCVWEDIIGQDRVSAFLRSAVTGGHVSHAYLFVGAPGSGKATAARALACAVLCADDGCGACGVCYRVRRGTHPDVHYVEPEGAAAYLKDQITDIIHDTNLAPVEGTHKIYVVKDADRFNEASANAFLKTLEEPPADVIIVLMTHSFDAVLPTIASRCQVVRFRRIPPAESAALLVAETGADLDRVSYALAAAGGVVVSARDFLASPSRQAARALILHTLKGLSFADDLDVLNAAKSLLVAVKAPLEEVEARQAVEVAERVDFLGKGATKTLADRHKRELTAREREGVREILNVAESWLRDCLVMSQGERDLVINTDASDAMEEVAALLAPSAAVTALAAVKETRRRISYNVSPQLAVEAMLFDIREVLRCPR